MKVVELSTYPELELNEDDVIDLFSKAKAVLVANPDNPRGGFSIIGLQSS